MMHVCQVGLRLQEIAQERRLLRVLVQCDANQLLRGRLQPPRYLHFLLCFRHLAIAMSNVDNDCCLGVLELKRGLFLVGTSFISFLAFSSQSKTSQFI